MISRNAKEIDRLLQDITVCDPAIGSGAFPVGMMQEIVRAREALSAVEGMPKRTAYELKRHAIQNSLYGVDIDPGAVEIAKLRLWLSLVVDEDDRNRIQALPNLDYKIMQGNSLLDEFAGVKLLDDGLLAQAFIDRDAQLAVINSRINELQDQFFELDRKGARNREMKQRFVKEIETLKRQKKQITREKAAGDLQASFQDLQSTARAKLSELKQLHQEFFDTSTASRKKVIRERLNNLEWEFMEATLRENANEEALGELVRHRRDNRKNYFLWKLHFVEVFQANGGFDAVIGNPPYGADIHEMTEILARLYAHTTKGFRDIYKIFVELALSKLLSPSGTLTYILPNTLLRQPRYKDARAFLANFRLRLVLNLGERVFEAIVPTCVLMVENSSPTDAPFRYRDLSTEGVFSGDFTRDEVLTDQNSFLGGDGVGLSSHDYNVDVVPLGDILDFKDAGINYQRVNVGLHEKGKSDLGQRLLYEGVRESGNDMEFWKGEDIDAYYISPRTDRFVRTKTCKRLRPNERVILNREYFSLTPKLIWRQTAAYPIAAIDKKGVWFGRSIQAGTLKEAYRTLKYEYLLGLMNSTYVRWIYNRKV